MRPVGGGRMASFISFAEINGGGEAVSLHPDFFRLLTVWLKFNSC